MEDNASSNELMFVVKIDSEVSDLKKAIQFQNSNKFSQVILRLTSNYYKREYRDEEVAAQTKCFTRSQLSLTYSQFLNIMPMIEISSDLDNENEEIRLNYEKQLVNDIQFALHVRAGGQIYIKPSPALKPYKIGKFLKSQIHGDIGSPHFIVEINLVNREQTRQVNLDEEVDVESSWCWWNKIHEASGFTHMIRVALVLSADVLEENEVKRWLGESIAMLVIPSDCFLSNSNNYPVFSKYNQTVFRLFATLCRPMICIEPNNMEDSIICHYRDYLKFQEKLVHINKQTPDQDLPNIPLQPLKDHLCHGTYEIFENDIAKYITYQRAIEAALKDMITEEEKETRLTVVMVVGAGRGPLIRCALNASVKTGRKIKIIAVEKNQNAINCLAGLIRDMWPDKDIELTLGDMRKVDYAKTVDILVSELLGSFGDNELSPECLDGIQHCLKTNGISIPCDSISYLRPVTSKKIYQNIIEKVNRKWELSKANTPIEINWLVYPASVYYIDEPKECFKFVHPNNDNPIDNCRHKTLEFSTKSDCVLTGFMGYFTSKLYKDIEISILPKTHTRGMTSWYPIYFSLPQHVTLDKNDRIELVFWRKFDEKKVWYEYQLIAPKECEVQNVEGKAHPILLKWD